MAQAIRSKDHYHEALVRSGIHLPAPKSSACTLRYLEKVKNGSYWCPKTDQIRLKACPRPPKLQILIQLLNEVADEDGIEFGFNASHTPEAKWIIEVLGTLRPDCYIFDKGYVPGVEIPIELD